MNFHTSEPWEWHRDILLGGPNKCTTILEAEDSGEHYGLHSAELQMENEEADKVRIVACVNALAGVEDPQAWMEGVARLRKAANEWFPISPERFLSMKLKNPENQVHNALAAALANLDKMTKGPRS